MSFTIKLQRNNSPDNKLTKNITDIVEFSGELRNETSIIDPVILIETTMSNVKGCNYFTVPNFGRKYFIKNIRTIRNGLIEISGHCDVLSTYAKDIRECTGITRRQEKEYNLLLNDGSLKVYQNPIIRVKQFPSGFLKKPEYVLAVAGR